MITYVTQFAADSSSSGIGALGIDAKALVIQLITFALAFLVLKKYAFGPIIKLMDERRKTIEQGVSLGEKMQKDQAAMDAKIASALGKARREADGIIASAQETGRQTVREAEAKARTKAESIVAEAKENTKRDVAAARRSLEKELVGLIANATEVIIDEKVDAKKDSALISRALKEQEAN